jgi:hypothetical protein
MESWSHEEVNRKVRLLVEDAENELVEPEVGFPVDVLGVVAAHVGTVVGELHPGPLLSRPMLAPHVARQHAARDELQVLELLHELFVEECRDGGHERPAL